MISQHHADNLPIIRIKKVTLDDFKSVGHGEIVFDCGRDFVPYGTKSDILGLYGQNGSGKTAFIEALAILKSLMSGSTVSNVYADCVTIDKQFTRLEFVFGMQYHNGVVTEATYSFCMGIKPLSKEEIAEKYRDISSINVPDEDNTVIIFDEKFFLLWKDVSKRQLIIDTSSTDYPFTPTTRRREYVGNDKKTLFNLEMNKQKAKNSSRSFIFMESTLKMFETKNNQSVALNTLVELRYYTQELLHVIDSKSSGYIRPDLAIPVYTRNGLVLFGTRNPKMILNDNLTELKNVFGNISLVLEQIVPGLTITLKEISPTLDKEGRPATYVFPVVNRDGEELPLRDESDGVRRIISVLALIIDSFNEESMTVVIDDFDTGVSEFLLGEILQALEESGCGQFIFTAHNLRPLEVLDRKYLYFTTTDPNNRYIRMKNISTTKNLRDAYLREIHLSEQDEEVYNKTKRYKIVSALKKARR